MTITGRLLLGLLGALLISYVFSRISGHEDRADEAGRVPVPRLEKATFAGGCFWCMEPPFDELEGVISTTVGYTGGHEENPTYEEVAAGGTGHAEAIQILYDPRQVSYAGLLKVFWHNIDPTVRDRQFCDVGRQYRTAIFYHDEDQKRLAEASKQRVIDSGRFENVYTEILPASTFYVAEEYHQDYYRKNPIRYKLYRLACGRDRRLEELWGEYEGRRGRRGR